MPLKTEMGLIVAEDRIESLDVTGLLCPLPVLRARRKLDGLRSGDTLIVTASDPASVQDMPAFCSMAGHKLLIAREHNGSFIFEIEKG